MKTEEENGNGDENAKEMTRWKEEKSSKGQGARRKVMLCSNGHKVTRSWQRPHFSASRENRGGIFRPHVQIIISYNN